MYSIQIVHMFRVYNAFCSTRHHSSTHVLPPVVCKYQGFKGILLTLQVLLPDGSSATLKWVSRVAMHVGLSQLEFEPNA